MNRIILLKNGQLDLMMSIGLMMTNFGTKNLKKISEQVETAQKKEQICVLFR